MAQGISTTHLAAAEIQARINPAAIGLDFTIGIANSRPDKSISRQFSQCLKQLLGLIAIG